MTKYLGYPDLAANRQLNMATAAQRFSVNGTNASLHSFTDTAGVNQRRNSVDADAYLHFPFLNRSLASPLELLSLRLYGSEWWTQGTDPNQWRLRFMDDYDYYTTAGSARVYRSRKVPWFHDDRTIDPNDPSMMALKSIPDLFRFFEFVECHSRMRNANNLYTSGGTPTSQRELRVPGKININTITDEEIFRALFDDQSAMPASFHNEPDDRAANFPPQYHIANWIPGYQFNRFHHLSAMSFWARCSAAFCRREPCLCRTIRSGSRRGGNSRGSTRSTFPPRNPWVGIMASKCSRSFTGSSF